MAKLDVVKEVAELKTQLAYSKNIGFFFGAGTSCAVKIPNIEMLTNSIEAKLVNEDLKHFQTIKKDLAASITARKVNVEDILNQTRQIRDITNQNKDKDFMGISGEAAKNLHKEICNLVYSIILESEATADLTIPRKFFAWLNILNRDFSKEVFTTNYDLIIEKSLEGSEIPYFDGFVGSYEPFFWQDSIEQTPGINDITKNWLRIWKLHGSLSWFWKQEGESQRIIRIGKFDKVVAKDNELVVYPSSEKYDSSRKQPYVAYFDRLRNYLQSGELLFIFAGYSFSDQHINEVVLNCLRQNNRLFVIVFCYQDTEVESLSKIMASYMNLNVFGPTKAIINGTLGEWGFDKGTVKLGEKSDLYWDEANNKLKLGDFNELVNFLVSTMGRSELKDATK